MARPVLNNLTYFSHDNDMRNDPKIKLVRKKFKAEGYAVYCMLLEYLSEKKLLQAPYDDFELEIMAADFDMTIDYLKEIVSFFVRERIELIQIVDGFIRCRQLDERARGVFDDRGRNLSDLRQVLPEFLGSFPADNSEKLPENADIKEKKRKRNKTKQNNNTVCVDKIKFLDWVYLTQEEHDKLLSRLGQKYLDRCIEKLDSYIENNDKGKKYTSHYKVMIQWVIESVGCEGLKEQPCNIEEIKAAAANKANIDKAYAEGMAEAEARKKELQEEDTAGYVDLFSLTGSIGKII